MSCMLLYVFDMFHILLSGDSLRDLWNVYMYVTCYSESWVPVICFRLARASDLYAPTSNSYIFTPIENWIHAYRNLFTWNSPYYHLLKYLLFLLKHSINCQEIFGRDHLLLISAQTIQTFLEKQMKTRNT